MTGNSVVLARILDGLKCDTSSLREEAANIVTDVHRHFSAEDLVTVTKALVTARLREEDQDCQDSELNALAELKAWHALPKEQVDALRVLEPAQLHGSQREYFEFLFVEGGKTET